MFTLYIKKPFPFYQLLMGTLPNYTFLRYIKDYTFMLQIIIMNPLLTRKDLVKLTSDKYHSNKTRLMKVLMRYLCELNQRRVAARSHVQTHRACCVHSYIFISLNTCATSHLCVKNFANVAKKIVS